MFCFSRKTIDEHRKSQIERELHKVGGFKAAEALLRDYNTLAGSQMVTSPPTNATVNPTEAPTEQYELANVGRNKCPAGFLSVPENECEAAANSLVPNGHKVRPLQSGSWNYVPPGCSVQSGGDWAVHYNTEKKASNDGSYSPVCKADPSATTAPKTITIAPTTEPKMKFIIECAASNDGGCGALDTKWKGCKAQGGKKSCAVKITTENYGAFNVVGDFQD
jgi:hypothetical protein